MFDARGFRRDVKRAMKEVERQAVLRIINITAEVIAELKAATPVDTTLAQNYWLVSSNGDPADPNWQQIGDVVPQSVMEELRGLKAGDQVVITNYAPYIVRLNQGWSAQAPAGFVEAAVQRVVSRHQE